MSAVVSSGLYGALFAALRSESHELVHFSLPRSGAPFVEESAVRLSRGAARRLRALGVGLRPFTPTVGVLTREGLRRGSFAMKRASEPTFGSTYEEAMVALVGRPHYESTFRPFVKARTGVDPSLLSASLVARLHAPRPGPAHWMSLADVAEAYREGGGLEAEFVDIEEVLSVELRDGRLSSLQTSVGWRYIDGPLWLDLGWAETARLFSALDPSLAQSAVDRAQVHLVVPHYKGPDDVWIARDDSLASRWRRRPDASVITVDFAGQLSESQWPTHDEDWLVLAAETLRLGGVSVDSALTGWVRHQKQCFQPGLVGTERRIRRWNESLRRAGVFPIGFHSHLGDPPSACWERL